MGALVTVAGFGNHFEFHLLSVPAQVDYTGVVSTWAKALLVEEFADPGDTTPVGTCRVSPSGDIVEVDGWPPADHNKARVEYFRALLRERSAFCPPGWRDQGEFHAAGGGMPYHKFTCGMLTAVRHPLYGWGTLSPSGHPYRYFPTWEQFAVANLPVWAHMARAARAHADQALAMCEQLGRK